MPATATTERRTGEPQRARIFLVEVEASCNHTGVEPNILGNKTISDTIFFNTSSSFFFFLIGWCLFFHNTSHWVPSQGEHTYYAYFHLCFSWFMSFAKYETLYLTNTSEIGQSTIFFRFSLCLFDRERESRHPFIVTVTYNIIVTFKVSESLWKSFNESHGHTIETCFESRFTKCLLLMSEDVLHQEKWGHLLTPVRLG